MIMWAKISGISHSEFNDEKHKYGCCCSSQFSHFLPRVHGLKLEKGEFPMSNLLSKPTLMPAASKNRRMPGLPSTRIMSNLHL